MKKLNRIRKIVIVVISSILILNLIPNLAVLFKELNINNAIIAKFFNSITDGIIAKASDTDFEYSGNLQIRLHKTRRRNYIFCLCSEAQILF